MKHMFFSRAGSEARRGPEPRIARPIPQRDPVAYAAALEILG